MALNENATRVAPEDDTAKDVRTVPVDDKGRPMPEFLSDRELTIEIATHLRVMYDAITALGSNPMLAAFMPPGIAKR